MNGDGHYSVPQGPPTFECPSKHPGLTNVEPRSQMRRYEKRDVGRNSSLTLSLRRELSVDFAQTILEIAPAMLLPGLHDNFERGVDRFSSLFKFRSIVGPHPQRRERAAEVVLGRGPVQRHPLAGPLLQGRAIGFDRLLQGRILPRLIAERLQCVGEDDECRSARVGIPAGSVAALVQQTAHAGDKKGQPVGAIAEMRSSTVPGKLGVAGGDRQAEDLGEVGPEHVGETKRRANFLRILFTLLTLLLRGG